MDSKPKKSHKNITNEELQIAALAKRKDDSPEAESKVGKKLSDLTTRRVIILVLAMMCSTIFLSLDTYRDDNNSFTFGLEFIHNFRANQTDPAFTAAFQSYISSHNDKTRTKVVILIYNET